MQPCSKSRNFDGSSESRNMNIILQILQLYTWSFTVVYKNKYTVFSKVRTGIASICAVAIELCAKI